jgi:hypothetical protein
VASDKAYAVEQRLDLVVATMLPQGYVLQNSKTINSVSDLAVGSMITGPLAAGSYVIQVALEYVAGQTGGTPTFSFHSTATVSIQAWNGIISVTTGTSTIQYLGNPAFNTVSMVSGSNYVVMATYSVTTTTAGTFQLFAHTSVAADTYVIAAGACMVVSPAQAA